MAQSNTKVSLGHSRLVKALVIAVVAAILMFLSTLVPDWSAPIHEHLPEGEHWSWIAQFFPGLIHNVYALVSPHKSYLFHETPDKVYHVIMATLVFFITIGFAIAVYRRVKREKPIIPDNKFTLLTFFEFMVETVYSLMAGMMGEEEARRHFPIIGTLAVFILFCNLLGLIPGFLPPTDTFSTNVAMSIVVFFATHYYGVRKHGVKYFAHFLGPVHKWYALPLMVLMVIIETISHLARPLSLAVRLMGNIMGDHTVLGVFLGFGILFVPLPIMALGFLVAIIQTLVFVLLSIVYFALAIEEHEE